MSQFAVYYHLLVSGRLASYRPNVRVGELLRLPYPTPREGLLKGIRTLEDVDQRFREEVGFDDVEWALVEDVNSYTMPDFKGGPDSPGRRRTADPEDGGDHHLASYCEFFLRVLQAGFGGVPSATVFQATSSLPVRLVAIHLEWPDRAQIVYETTEAGDLLQRLVELGNLLSVDSPTNSSHFGRQVRVYDSVSSSGRQVPTVFIVKPDQKRYWTRSAALRDADDVAADVVLWRAERPDSGSPPTAEVSSA